MSAFGLLLGLLRSTLCYSRLSITCLVIEIKTCDSFVLIDLLLA